MKSRRRVNLPTEPMQTSGGGDFLPTADLEMMRLRAELLRRTREFFAERDFLEVETPLLSADTVVDRHLDPFSVEVSVGRRYYFQTSPEFGMKRLLATGAEAIYQITRAFRRDEVGPLHNPEFTMVEWYRVGHDMDQGMTLLGELAEMLFHSNHNRNRGQAERMSYREAFERYVGLDPHTAKTSELVAAASEKQIDVPESFSTTDRDGWLDVLLVELVQPHLGRERPLILYDYPASQAALAKTRDDGDDKTKVAERFELYVDGIELANGYHELTDAEELALRNTQVNLQRQMDGKEPLPSESRLLAAMRAGLPQCTGVALGFDRTVMLAAGAKNLAQVMPFPFDRA